MVLLCSAVQLPTYTAICKSLKYIDWYYALMDQKHLAVSYILFQRKYVEQKQQYHLLSKNQHHKKNCTGQLLAVEYNHTL